MSSIVDKKSIMFAGLYVLRSTLYMVEAHGTKDGSQGPKPHIALSGFVTVFLIIILYLSAHQWFKNMERRLMRACE